MDKAKQFQSLITNPPLCDWPCVWHFDALLPSAALWNSGRLLWPLSFLACAEVSEVFLSSATTPFHDSVIVSDALSRLP